ncbi:unnamed protein product [Musa acuminata subsp. burmannicoides]
MLDITSLTMEYDKSIDYAEIFRSAEFILDHKIRPNSEDLHFASEYWQNFGSQCSACLWKLHKSYWKNPEFNVVHFVTTVGTSNLFGIVFCKIGSNITSEQDIFNNFGVMYASALFQGFVNAILMQPLVWMERTVLYREGSAGMYTSMAYTIAQVAVETPFVILQVLLFSCMG